MRLQRLEIAGFKSFPDRSELTFDTGVTAIVGPNGCGKSNVVDALTWVLGEQSAKSLRGDRMEDLIFGGSDARRPTGAAEVRLKLSGVAARVPGAAPGPNGRHTSHVTGNGHGNGNGNGNGNGHGHGNGNSHGRAAVHAHGDLEAVDAGAGGAAAVAAAILEDDTPLIVRDVELMRRLYRSGESEYLIDGEICRLRDVQDLLMDAGLGVKGYAVIEQGKIGQILSARPTDRRQLIEEAAGVTKYKSRRRAAELKLEAAQQNLTRVDDIVFEVEKQRGTLKRQAAKARRYRRLREELRRWEKVQFAQRYRTLGAAIESALTRLAQARERESMAAAHLAEVETALETLRLQLVEADTNATNAREQAHARELATGRLQQQIAFDKHQVETLGVTAAEIEAEVATLEARREPARLELESRREASSRSTVERDQAAANLAAEERTYSDVQTRIEGLEGDVEAARSEVFAAVNAATALRHAMEHAAASRSRIGEQIAKLEIEGHDLRVEADRAAQDRAAADGGLQRAREAMEQLSVERAAREAELAAARSMRERRAYEFRAAEQQLAADAARLRSLEELDAARAEYGDGARLVLAESNGNVGQMGSVADYLEVDGRFEPAVEACLGDLLQHVVVRTHDAAAAGLQFASERNAGRVGFVVATQAAGAMSAPAVAEFSGLTPMTQVVRVSGPAEHAITAAIAHAWVADSPEAARVAFEAIHGPIATLDGQVFRGPHVVEGGARAEARGILATKREIKELRERLDVDRADVERLREEIATLDVSVAAAEAAIASVHTELHRQEKVSALFEMQSTSATEAADRVARKQEQIAIERRTSEEELRSQESRQDEARESIARIEIEQRSADDRLNQVQRRLFEAREEMQAQGRRTAEAKAAHAALMERASALAIEVQRLEDAGRELENRVTSRRDELRRAETRREELRQTIVKSEAELDAGLREFDDLRQMVRAAEEQCQLLRSRFEEQEARIKDARRRLESIRAEAAQLDVARATAEADLTHLSAACVESVQATLDEVALEVEQLESEGVLSTARPVDDAPEPSEADGDGVEESFQPGEMAEAADAGTGPIAVPAAALTADEMVLDLRAKIDRMGPVNMMAIDQFDDLESRHTFLTTQRKDLIDSIAATGEAIKKIDKTTRERFKEAFTVINQNFEKTFTTLFGGGRAGLMLLDESDALESGIDIIAQPPGKRLQHVQLLSGGEKALSAMALMFAIFQYRPSPFCLLDEIDAPLDDANIGRFVEMLQGMQDHTQFILITHNRKTMEIADRLYGVTMEEPGVSKLISVQLN
jgi:chromosome segregation protein